MASLLFEEYAASGRVEAKHLAIAVFSIAETGAAALIFRDRELVIKKLDRPISNLDGAQKHLFEQILFPRRVSSVTLLHDESKVGTIRCVDEMNRKLRTMRRPSDRHLGVLPESSISFLLDATCDESERDIRFRILDWVREQKNGRPSWWNVEVRNSNKQWPGAQGDSIHTVYKTLVKSLA